MTVPPATAMQGTEFGTLLGEPSDVLDQASTVSFVATDPLTMQSPLAEELPANNQCQAHTPTRTYVLTQAI